MDARHPVDLKQLWRSPRHPKEVSSRFQGRIRNVVLCFTIIVGAAGCFTPAPSPPPPAPPVSGYVVGAPDQLLVTILPEPEISRAVRVRPDGMISIDLIGDVQASGRTPFEIAAAIQQAIGRFKRDASVNVMVVDTPSQFVTVYGEVVQPGIFSLDTVTRLSEAIGRVGGAKPFASLNSVRVIRTIGNETKVIPIRLSDISKGNLSTNITIRKGDLIIVPPTLLAKIGYAVQMVLFPFQPFIAIGATAGNIARGAQAF